MHRYNDYVRTLTERSYPLEPYASYVETCRQGIPPHGGFAIGLERPPFLVRGAGPRKPIGFRLRPGLVTSGTPTA